MAAAELAVGTRRADPNAVLAAIVAATVVPIVAAIVLAPDGSGRSGAALTTLLFVGSSMHVASTGWFYTVPEVRRHMRSHTVRYAWVPLSLVAGAAVLAVALTPRMLEWLLVAFFAWQFFHFQKQNLGVAALVARTRRAPALSRLERAALVVTGVGGIAGLVGHPALLALSQTPRLDWLFRIGLALFAVGAVVGVVALSRSARRDSVSVGVYLVSLLFFVPVWLFSSPYAAVAGLTIAHGLQYLLLMALVAAGGRDRMIGLLVLLNVALLLGLVLNLLSHLHDADAPMRALYGVFLGLSTAHFVVDAGLWRLREEFPRTFLRERLPYLLA